MVDWSRKSATKLPTLSRDKKAQVETGEQVWLDYRSTAKMKGLRATVREEAVIEQKQIHISYEVTKWEILRVQLFSWFLHIVTLPLCEASFLVSESILSFLYS